MGAVSYLARSIHDTACRGSRQRTSRSYSSSHSCQILVGIEVGVVVAATLRSIMIVDA